MVLSSRHVAMSAARTLATLAQTGLKRTSLPFLLMHTARSRKLQIVLSIVSIEAGR